MKNISLLPPELFKEKRARQRQRYYIIFAAALALLFLINAALFLLNLNAQSHVNFLEQQRENTEGQVAGLQEYAEMKERAEEVEGLLRQAMGAVPDWDLLLINVAGSMPGEVWLSELDARFEVMEGMEGTENAGEGDVDADIYGEIVIRGHAFNHEAVASWLQSLEEQEGLREVRCRFSQEVDLEGLPSVQFEITAYLEPGVPYEEMLEGGQT